MIKHGCGSGQSQKCQNGIFCQILTVWHLDLDLTLIRNINMVTWYWYCSKWWPEEDAHRAESIRDFENFLLKIGFFSANFPSEDEATYRKQADYRGFYFFLCLSNISLFLAQLYGKASVLVSLTRCTKCEEFLK